MTASVPPTVSLPEVVILVADALASVLFPTTVSVPLEVKLEDEALASAVCPVTVSVPVAITFVAERFDVEALPRYELAERMEVKVGVSDVEMVEVPVSEILVPAVK